MEKQEGSQPRTAKTKKKPRLRPRSRTNVKLQPRTKIMLGAAYKIASLNIWGTQKTGTNDEVQKAEKTKHKIAASQETRVNQNTREAIKHYIWLCSGEGGRKSYTAGAALVIHSIFFIT